MRVLESLERVVADKEDFFIIKWRPTWLCNYKCDYCIQKSRHPEFNKDDLAELQNKTEEIAVKLSAMIERIGADKTKLELVGGECSLLELTPILEKITSKRLTRVQFTTNGYRPIEYYKELAKSLASRNVELSLQISWHSQYCTLDDYIAKCKVLAPLCTRFKCETVLTYATREQVKGFEQRCKDEGLDYIVEVDLRESEHRMRQALRPSMEKSFKLEKSAPRYRCEFSENSELFEQYYPTRNLFISDPLNAYDTENSKYVITAGKLCTYGMDYCYVDTDGKVGWNNGSDKDAPPCVGRIDIDEFNRQKEPGLCNVKCTLCGNVSVYSPQAWFRKQEKDGKK